MSKESIFDDFDLELGLDDVTEMPEDKSAGENAVQQNKADTPDAVAAEKPADRNLSPELDFGAGKKKHKPRKPEAPVGSVPVPSPEKIPHFPKDKYRINGERVPKEVNGQYTFLCPNCGTPLTSEDCVVDFYRAIKKYMTGEFGDLARMHEMNQILFPENEKSRLFYEADMKTVAALKTDSQGYKIVTCRDVLLCMLRKVYPEQDSEKLLGYIPVMTDDDVLKVTQTQELVKSFIRCLDHCGVYRVRRDTPEDLNGIADESMLDISPLEVSRMQTYLAALYDEQDLVLLRAKIEPHMSPAEDGHEYFAGFDFEFEGLQNTMIIQERRCPQPACGSCVSRLSGKAPEFVVGMLGGPGSGKTAYMVALLAYLEQGVRGKDGEIYKLQRCGIRAVWDKNDCDNGMGDFILTYLEGYKEGKFAAKTTARHNRHYTIELSGWACPAMDKNPVDQSRVSPEKFVPFKRLLTVVDIAGELLSDRDELKAVVSEADIYWFCISPAQLDKKYEAREIKDYTTSNAAVSGQTESSDYKISDILEVINNAKILHEIHVPVSLILTKSDMMAGDEDVCAAVYGSGDESFDIGDMINLSPDELGTKRVGSKGFVGYKTDAIARYQSEIRDFFNGGGRIGRDIVTQLYPNPGERRRYGCFACAAFGTSKSGGIMRPYGVFQPFLWTLTVLGILPAVRPAPPVEKKVGGIFSRKTVSVYNPNYQAEIFTPGCFCKEGSNQKNIFEKLVFWD